MVTPARCCCSSFVKRARPLTTYPDTRDDHGGTATPARGSAGTIRTATAGTGRPAIRATATVTGAQRESATISPRPLAEDLRSADNRDCPSHTDSLGAALADAIGGPVGRHALIGRARLMTPVRVMFVIALIFMALGWSTKAACLQSSGTGTGDQRVANWDNQRAYYELCYSDTVPLYGAELLNKGLFPYKSSWTETDSSGTPQTRYDGKPAVIVATSPAAREFGAKAGVLAKQAAGVLGGGGGGKDDLAQGGGSDIQAISSALAGIAASLDG